MVETIREAALIDLGWSSFFADQVSAEEIGLEPVRITHIHRARMIGHSATGPINLALSDNSERGDYAVGDFVLTGPGDLLVRRRLARASLLSRG